jgi:undecaprenyl-diphosphatase
VWSVLHVRVYKQLIGLITLLIIPAAFIWNTEIFFMINCQKHFTFMNWFFLVLTSLADGLWVMMIATVVYSIRPRDFGIFMLALILGNVFLQSGKYLFDFDRPLRIFGEAKVCVLGLPVTVRSFPSGHAFSAMLLFMFIRPLSSRWLTILLFVFCALAALSRVYVGAHFPRDVVMGGLIAVASYMLAEIIAAKFRFRKPRQLLWILGIASLGSGTALIYIFKYTEKTPALEFVLTPLAWLVALYWLLFTSIHLTKAVRRSPG